MTNDREAHQDGYSFTERDLMLVSVCRRGRMTYKEASKFLKTHDVEMSESKYSACKKFLEESIESRIHRIASFEYVDMHLQLLDKSKEMFARLDEMAREARVNDDPKVELKVYDETRQTIGLIKELYNSSTIVGAVETLVKKHMHELPKEA